MRNGAIVAAVVMLAGGCGGERSGAGLEAIVAPDAVAVAAVDFGDLRKTEAGKKLMARLGAGTLARFGLDSADEVDRVLIFASKDSVAGGVEGRFDTGKVAAKARERSAAAMAAGNGRVVAGEAGAVAGAIKRLDAGGGGLPAPIGDLVAAIPPGQPVWAVARAGFRFAFPDKSNWRNLNRLLGSVETVRVWVDASSGAVLEIRGDCASEEGAAKLLRQVNGLRDMVGLSLPEGRPELREALSRVAVRQEGMGVAVTAAVPAELLNWALGGGTQ